MGAGVRFLQNRLKYQKLLRNILESRIAIWKLKLDHSITQILSITQVDISKTQFIVPIKHQIQTIFSNYSARELIDVQVLTDVAL